jgi:hypothetical protein
MLLSAAPVTLRYGYDNDLLFNGGIVHTRDNLDFNNSTLLASAKDVVLNNDELLILTDNIKLSDCLTSVFAVSPASYVYSTLITNTSGNYLYATNPVNTGSSLSFTNNILSATVFNFYFPASASTVQISYTVNNNDGTTTDLYVVTNTGTATVSGGVVTGIDPTYYTYYYILSGVSFSLISPAVGNWLSVNSPTSLGFYALSATSANQITIPSTLVFNATRFSNNNLYGQLQVPGRSDLVKYYKTDKTLDIQNDSGNVPFNYLISTAYKTLSSETLSANINTLKNYYSPLHDQTTVLNTQLRTYNKIYTGLNQNTGSDKIYLGYNSSTNRLVFEPDQDTYFHYPYGNNTSPLSTSTLIDYGSRADITPWRSDKIFKKVANYKNYSHWGNSAGAYYTNGSTLQKGIYFCSWLSAATTLSGSIDTESRPVWVDRYYDPDQVNLYGISLANILALSGILVNSANNYPNLIFDVPSNLTFEPGVLYYYHRIGETDNETIVNSFSGLTYHITDWAPNLINKVNSLTAGKINNFTTANSGINSSVKTPYYKVENTYGFIDTDESDFATNKGNTLSFYAYQQDWSQIAGNQIVGNYFNGGIGVFNNTPYVTPYFTVAAYNSAGNTIRTFNSNLELLNYETITTLVSSGAPALSAYATPAFCVKGVYDSSYYVVDNYPNNYFLSTYDPDDLLTKKTPLTASAPLLSSGKIVDVYLHKDISTSTDYIITKNHLTPTSVCYNKFTTKGALVSSAYNTTYNNFIIDINGDAVFYNSNVPNTNNTSVSGYEIWTGTNACTDGFNNVFTLSGNGTISSNATTYVLTKNGTPILTVTSPESISCDQDNNIWITYNNKYVAKVDGNGKVLWSAQINTEETIVTPYSNRTINFIIEETKTGNAYYALIIDGKSQHIYKVNTNGVIVNKILVSGLIPGSDSTGFVYQNKYIRPYISVPGIEVKLVVRDGTLYTPEPQYITLNYSVSGLGSGWHHFAVTYSENNQAKLYVDGNLATMTSLVTPVASSTNVQYRLYNYKNNPQIALGTSNFKTSFLNVWIEQEEQYLFNGNLADVRFYNITLTNSDIKAISKNYLTNEFTGINWNIPTGTRGYIEEIERFFLHRMPGSKSQFFNIRIKNSGLTDPNVRKIVENNLLNAVTQVAPAYTKLRSIIWE